MRLHHLLVGALLLGAGCSNDGSPDGRTAGEGSGRLGSGGSGGAEEDGGVGIIPQCETTVLSADRATANMLIVLDRSTSMTQNDDNTDRWSGSVDAVTTVVQELEDRIRFGLMTFPAAGRGFDQCAPGQLDEPLQILNGDAITDTLQDMRNGGYTPTAQTLAEARAVMSEQANDTLGEFALTQYVMLVTDGDPNCFSDQLTGDTQAQQASIQAVRDLTGDGVVTYVIGFQTGGSDFAGVLDEMAEAGGTGAMQHRSVDSGDELLEEFRRIAGGAVSCSFVLSSPADEAHVTITVDGEPTRYDTDWRMRDDNTTIDLLGSVCDQLQSGEATVEATVSCDVVNII